jgi:alkanesulfonate monooxygenase SsuD/methylene tetrahydromethanopterin reductase-like flavin-dependent oxidoreductase (luciferase family)
VTGGRIAYNAVVSGFPQEAQNFGYDTTPDHEWRYRRAEEFLEVIDKLYNSVDPDAMLWDLESGRVADPKKVRRIDHVGEHFKVMGPLPCAPCPQGRPIQVQAGQSASGMKLAGRWADMQFVVGDDLKLMAEHRAKLDAAAIAAGRKPRDVGILWAGLYDVVSGPEESRENARKYLDSIPERVGIVLLSQWWGLDSFKLHPSRTVVDTIQEIKETGAGPNWGYLEHAGEHRLHGHARGDRRPAGGGALRRRRQWRLHDRAPDRKSGRHRPLRPRGRAGAAAAGPDAHGLCRAEDA